MWTECKCSVCVCFFFQVQKMSLWRCVVDKQKVSHDANANGDSVCAVAKSKRALLGVEDFVKTSRFRPKPSTKDRIFQRTPDSTTSEATFLITLYM